MGVGLQYFHTLIRRQFGWCTGFTVDNSSKCSLSSFDYSILQKKESDVPGAATKVYIVRGRENGKFCK